MLREGKKKGEEKEEKGTERQKGREEREGVRGGTHTERKYTRVSCRKEEWKSIKQRERTIYPISK